MTDVKTEHELTNIEEARAADAMPVPVMADVAIPWSLCANREALETTLARSGILDMATVPKVPLWPYQVLIQLWTMKNLRWLWVVNSALHFSDKPPVVVIIKAAVLSFTNINPSLVLFFFLVQTFVKTFANIVKDTVQIPRPMWCFLRPTGHASISERSFSSPSCHTVFVSSVTLIMACHFQTWPFWVLYGVLSLAMALSRVALGMHWPFDVSAALVLCACTVPALYALRQALWFDYVDTPEGILTWVLVYAAASTAIYVCVYALCMLVIGVPEGVKHIADDYSLFKRIQWGTEFRDNSLLAGVGVGVFIHWKLTLDTVDFQYRWGLASGVLTCGGCAALLILGAQLRKLLRLNAWSPPDYAMKCIIYFIVGVYMVACNGMFWWVGDAWYLPHDK